MSAPMPGWYPDPEAPERQRFWDGTQWTEARAYPANVVGAEGTEVAAVAEEEGKRSPWPWIALIAVVAVALLAGAYYFTTRSSEEPAPLPSLPLPTVTDTVTPPTPTATATATKTAAPHSPPASP